MKKFLFSLNLQFFSEEGGEPEVITEEAPASVEGEGEGVASLPDVDEVITSEGEEVDQSKAFAKRLEERTQAKLQEARQQWEQEQSERYGDYDHYKKVTDYILDRGGYGDINALNEAIEQQRLEELAAENNATPEMMRRLEELEAKAQKAEEYEKQQEQVQTYRQFRTALEDFSKEKQMNADELETFMVENNIANFDIAHKALRAEQLEQQLVSAKETAIKEYLESKKAPRVESTGAAGVVADEPTTDFNVARQRALERLRAANQPN